MVPLTAPVSAGQQRDNTLNFQGRLPHQSQRRREIQMSAIRKYGPTVFVIVVVLLLVGGVYASLSKAKTMTATSTSTNRGAVNIPATTATPAASASVCAPTWPMVAGNYGDLNRWFNDGVAAIRNAKTDNEARQAINTWLDGVKQDPVLLAGASRIFLHKDVATSDLQQNSCASPVAANLTMDLAALMGNSAMTASQAPANAYNTGVANGQVVVNAFAGVSGDTTAIQITLPDGSKVWVMARCGNPVVPSNPGLPPGPTDNPKPTPTPTPHDECTNVPGDQPVGYPCPKTGQTGAITNGNHDPSGGAVDPVNNPLTPVETSRPVVTDRQSPGPAPTTAAPTVAPTTVQVVTTAPATTVAPSTQPPKTGVVPTTAPSASCNPDFQSCS